MVMVLEISKGNDKYWSKEIGESVLLYHRDNDMPAIIFNDGDKRWYKDNNLIRQEIFGKDWLRIKCKSF